MVGSSVKMQLSVYLSQAILFLNKLTKNVVLLIFSIISFYFWSHWSIFLSKSFPAWCEIGQQISCISLKRNMFVFIKLKMFPGPWPSKMQSHGFKNIWPRFWGRPSSMRGRGRFLSSLSFPDKRRRRCRRQKSRRRGKELCIGRPLKQNNVIFCPFWLKRIFFD